MCVATLLLLWVLLQDSSATGVAVVNMAGILKLANTTPLVHVLEEYLGADDVVRFWIAMGKNSTLLDIPINCTMEDVYSSHPRQRRKIDWNKNIVPGVCTNVYFYSDGLEFALSHMSAFMLETSYCSAAGSSFVTHDEPDYDKACEVPNPIPWNYFEEEQRMQEHRPCDEHIESLGKYIQEGGYTLVAHLCGRRMKKYRMKVRDLVHEVPDGCPREEKCPNCRANSCPPGARSGCPYDQWMCEKCGIWDPAPKPTSAWTGEAVCHNCGPLSYYPTRSEPKHC